MINDYSIDGSLKEISVLVKILEEFFKKIDIRTNSETKLKVKLEEKNIVIYPMDGKIERIIGNDEFRLREIFQAEKYSLFDDMNSQTYKIFFTNPYKK